MNWILPHLSLYLICGINENFLHAEQRNMDWRIIEGFSLQHEDKINQRVFVYEPDPSIRWAHVHAYSCTRAHTPTYARSQSRGNASARDVHTYTELFSCTNGWAHSWCTSFFSSLIRVTDSLFVLLLFLPLFFFTVPVCLSLPKHTCLCSIFLCVSQQGRLSFHAPIQSVLISEPCRQEDMHHEDMLRSCNLHRTPQRTIKLCVYVANERSMSHGEI